jgi:hypothetical protein
MILRRVELGRFGRWTDHVFEFRRGANLVLGGNEAGKSTLALAIPAVLFGVQDKERFVPWGGEGECAAALVCEDRQHFWRLERNILTDEVVFSLWHEGGAILRQFSGRAEVGVPAGEYAELLREFCGVGDGESFAMAAFGPLALDTGLPHLQTPFSAEGDLAEDSPSNSAFQEELQGISKRLVELEKRWYELRPVAGQLKNVQSELEGLPTQPAVPSQPPEADEPAATEATPIEDCLPPARERLAELHGRRQHLQEELARLGLPSPMPPDLPLLLAEAEALRRELVSLQKESVVIREARAARAAPPWKTAAVISALSLLLGLAGSLWFAWSATGWLGGGLLAAMVWLVNSRPSSRHRAEDARLKGQAQAIEGRREMAQELLTALDERFKALGVSPSAVSLVKMQKSIARGQMIADELRLLEGALSALEELQDKGCDTFAVAPSTAADKTGPAPSSTPPAAAAVLQPHHQDLLQEQERLQGLLRERQQIEAEGERLREREALLNRQLKMSPSKVGVPAEDPSAERRQFADECTRLLALLAGRRPWQVAVANNGSLLLREGRGPWCSPLAYGHGAGDLLGLVTRLAAHGDCQLPFLFDEALVHVERPRLVELFGALERVAAERQVIVFCREDQLPKRLARDRWQVLSLSEEFIPRERDDHAGQMHLL